MKRKTVELTIWRGDGEGFEPEFTLSVLPSLGYPDLMDLLRGVAEPGDRAQYGTQYFTYTGSALTVLPYQQGRRMRETLYLTPDDVAALKQAYTGCEGETFEFKGREMLKAYAKYLIQYLDSGEIQPPAYVEKTDE